MKKNLLLLLLTAALTQHTLKAASYAGKFNEGDEDYELAAAANPAARVSLRSEATVEDERQIHSAPEPIEHPPLSELFPNYELPDYGPPHYNEKGKLVLPTEESCTELSEKFFKLKAILAGDASSNIKNFCSKTIFNTKFSKKLKSTPDSDSKKTTLIAAIQVVVEGITQRNDKKIFDLTMFFAKNLGRPEKAVYTQAKQTKNYGKINELHFLLIEQPQALAGKGSATPRSASAPESRVRAKRTVSFAADDEFEKVRVFPTKSSQLDEMHTQYTYEQPPIEDLASWLFKLDQNGDVYWEQEPGTGAQRHPHFYEISEREAQEQARQATHDAQLENVMLRHQQADAAQVRLEEAAMLQGRQNSVDSAYSSEHE